MACRFSAASHTDMCLAPHSVGNKIPLPVARGNNGTGLNNDVLANSCSATTISEGDGSFNISFFPNL
ncbi:MAG: hypothetical protein Q8P67_09045 [archaeon]|nr:hypothetical protein [archaeon]